MVVNQSVCICQIVCSRDVAVLGQAPPRCRPLPLSSSSPDPSSAHGDPSLAVAAIPRDAQGKRAHARQERPQPRTVSQITKQEEENVEFLLDVETVVCKDTYVWAGGRHAFLATPAPGCSEWSGLSRDSHLTPRARPAATAAF